MTLKNAESEVINMAKKIIKKTVKKETKKTKEQIEIAELKERFESLEKKVFGERRRQSPREYLYFSSIFGQCEQPSLSEKIDAIAEKMKFRFHVRNESREVEVFEYRSESFLDGLKFWE